MRNKFLYFILILSMVMSLTVPISASAEDGESTGNTEITVVDKGDCSRTSDDNVSWVLTADGTFTVSGTGAMSSYTYDVNDTTQSDAPWNSLKPLIKAVVIEDGVTAVGAATFNGCANLTSVTIPEGVTVIYGCAFWNCTGLTSIDIPAGVGTLEPSVFRNTGLTSITLPDSIEIIKANAFKDCSSLESITIPAGVTTIGSGCFTGCSSLTDVKFGGDEAAWSGITIEGGNDPFTIANIIFTIETVPDELKPDFDEKTGTLTITGTGAMSNYSTDSEGRPVWYAYRDDIKAVVIGDGVESIGTYAFADCTNLASITISADVASIGMSAFAGCSSLEGITIPDTVASLGMSIFEGSGLTSVTIGRGITGIPAKAFVNCKSLTEIAIPEGVISIGMNAFTGSGLVSVNISDTVTSIGSSAFSYCSSLTDIAIPASVTELGDGLFSYCTGLKAIPEGITRIGYYMFTGCTGLESITIPTGIAKVEAQAFRYCTGLRSVILPDGVTHISDYTFADCPNLTSIEIPASLTNIGTCAFEGSDALTVIDYKGSAENWGKVTVKAGNDRFMDKIIISGTCGEAATWIYQKGTLTIGGTGAMEDYTAQTSPWYALRPYIETVEIEDSITLLGKYAFYNLNKVTSVTLPKDIDSINYAAFFRCTSLQSVTIPESVAYIGSSAFRATGLTSVTIPGNVTSTGTYVFADCTNLTSVTIPLSLTTISGNVFSNCPALTDVKYEGSKYEWAMITINASGNEALQAANITYGGNNIPLQQADVAVVDGGLEVTLTYKFEDCYVYTAVYDRDSDEIINIICVPLDTEADSTIVELDTNPTVYARVFIWTEDIRPITEVATVDFQTT